MAEAPPGGEGSPCRAAPVLDRPTRRPHRRRRTGRIVNAGIHDEAHGGRSLRRTSTRISPGLPVTVPDGGTGPLLLSPEKEVPNLLGCPAAGAGWYRHERNIPAGRGSESLAAPWRSARASRAVVDGCHGTAGWWDPSGVLYEREVEELTRSEAFELVRDPDIQVAVAHASRPLRWVARPAAESLARGAGPKLPRRAELETAHRCARTTPVPRRALEERSPSRRPAD